MANSLPAVIPQDNSTALIAIVCKEHEAVVLGMSYAYGHAMAAGDALWKLKDAVPRGQWLPRLKQLEQQGGPSVRTAQVYMRLADGRATVAAKANAQRASHLSVRGALALLKTPRKTSPIHRSRPTDEKAPKITQHDVFAWLNTAPVEKCQRVFDGLGSRKVATFIPSSWNLMLVPAGSNLSEVVRLNRHIASLKDELHDKKVLLEKTQRQLRKLGPVFAAPDVGDGDGNGAALDIIAEG